MKAILVIIAVFAISAGMVAVPLVSEQFAEAGAIRKIHFTHTVTSSPDPGRGNGGQQMALILSPNTGTIYDGSMTYAASVPVRTVILHEIVDGQSRGQPVWTVDGKTEYAISVGPEASSGSIEFTGAALALHSDTNTEFAVTASVDAWTRGQPTEVIMQRIELETQEPELRLARSSVPAHIPMHAGLYDGEKILYIITDASGQEDAEHITERQGWKVELAPSLLEAPESALADVYAFTDGIFGEGIHGYQDEVFSSTPAQADGYSALRSVNSVEWKPGQNPEILDSEEEILDARDDGRVKIEETGEILNMPQVSWPEGRMPAGNSTEEGHTIQIIKMDEEAMTVTFAAHRGWGPDGQTIYYIITDATPDGPARMMGVVDAPASASLSGTGAAAKLYQFNNGIIGTGQLGFQPRIASAVLGDEGYSPMWQVHIIEWNDSSQASVLQTQADIDALNLEEAISVKPARPLNSDHIINSPLVDPFQPGGQADESDDKQDGKADGKADGKQDEEAADEQDDESGGDAGDDPDDGQDEGPGEP